MRGHYSDVWQAVAAALPDRPAIVTRDETVDYARFAREAGALAAHLQASGVAAGDSVAILMHNRPEYLTTLFATLATGVAPTPINYRFRATEVADLLRDSGARAIVYPATLGPVVAEAVALTGTAPALVEVADGGPGVPGAVPFGDVVAASSTLPPTPPPGGELRLYTGGTTGRPKAVVWAGEDIVSIQLFSTYVSAGLPVPRTMADVVAAAADPGTRAPRTLPLAPFMHGTALFTSMNTLLRGGTVVINPSSSLDADDVVRLVLETAVTQLVVAGDAVAIPLVEAAERAGLDRLGEVRSVLSSGMRFSDETKGRLHDLGDITVVDLLASTEGGPYAVALTHGRADLPARLRLLPGAVVLDVQQREVQDTPGATGVLAFRGTLPQGYFNDPVKTAETFRTINGARHVVVGDWVEVLPDGYVELLGRGSSVVNTGGEKVFPVEVENALLTFPGIADAVVFGVPDPRFGEVVAATVVPDRGVELDLTAVEAHLAARLAGYKKPRRIFVRPTLQRSPHGKIDMRRLHQDAAQHMEEGIPS